MASQYDNSSLAQQFNNEKPGNCVAWRIVINEWNVAHDEPPYFVYRRIFDEGWTKTQYLQHSGEIERSCSNGHFASLAEVGAALIAHDRIHGLNEAGEITSTENQPIQT